MTYYRRGDSEGWGARAKPHPRRADAPVYREPRKFGRRLYGKTRVKEKFLSQMDGDIKAFMKTLTDVNDRMSFYRLATEHISYALINVCQLILHQAVDYAPYRTGRLRSSGEVRIRSGRKQTENIAVMIRAKKDGTWEPDRLIESLKRPASLISAEVRFERVDRGRDIALWTHEELLDYSERQFRDTVLLPSLSRLEKIKGIPEEDRRTQIYIATKEGTGPKYLSRAADLWTGYIPDRLAAAFQAAIGEYNKKHGTQVRSR